MKQINSLYKSGIVLFSESLWIYYVIILFTSIEWDLLITIDVTWWIAAALFGYSLNKIFFAKFHFVILLIGNVLALSFIIIQNWIILVPEGKWVFGIIVSITVGFIYFRSFGFVNKIPKRQDMLRRFEGNIILYIIFLWIFTVKEWTEIGFHLVFLVAIFLSLIGMIITLKSQEHDEGNQHAEIRTVGRQGWFTSVITTLFLIITFISLLLLLPPIQKGLISIGITIWDVIKGLILKVVELINWLLTLFPATDVEGPVLFIPPGDGMIIPDERIETGINFPIIWIIIGIVVIFFIVIIIVLLKQIKKRKIPKSIQVQQIIIIRESWWNYLLNQIKTILKLIKYKWRSRFPKYYRHKIYWYFHQVKNWGKKNGVSYLNSETSKEYIEKLISKIPKEDNVFQYNGKQYDLSYLLLQLNREYQSTYYGNFVHEPIEDFQILIQKLNTLHLNSYRD